MSAAAMGEISGAKKFGPVVSGWKRRTQGLGIDLDTLLVRTIDKATGKVVYKITPEGKDALHPGADVSRGRQAVDTDTEGPGAGSREDPRP